jgi:hypothetical protein
MKPSRVRQIFSFLSVLILPLLLSVSSIIFSVVALSAVSGTQSMREDQQLRRLQLRTSRLSHRILKERAGLRNDKLNGKTKNVIQNEKHRLEADRHLLLQLERQLAAVSAQVRSNRIARGINREDQRQPLRNLAAELRHPNRRTRLQVLPELPDPQRNPNQSNGNGTVNGATRGPDGD